MRQTTTAEVRLDEGKANEFQRREAGNRSLRPPAWHPSPTNSVATAAQSGRKSRLPTGNPGNAGTIRFTPTSRWAAAPASWFLNTIEDSELFGVTGLLHSALQAQHTRLGYGGSHSVGGNT